MSNEGKITDEQLLKMAMGVRTGDEVADATTDVMKYRADWEVIPSRGIDRLTKRRKMRHEMFKIVKRLTRELEITAEDHAELLAIKAIVDPQLEEARKTNQQINWYSFTFHWDIHPKDHTKIILKPQWFAEGGTFDEFGAMKPTAFTEQQID